MLNEEDYHRDVKRESIIDSHIARNMATQDRLEEVWVLKDTCRKGVIDENFQTNLGYDGDKLIDLCEEFDVTLEDFIKYARKQIKRGR